MSHKTAKSSVTTDLAKKISDVFRAPKRGQLGNLEDIYKCFEKGLEKPIPRIRMQAVFSMNKSFKRDKRMKPILEKMIKDKNEKVRKIAEQKLEILKRKNASNKQR